MREQDQKLQSSSSGTASPRPSGVFVVLLDVSTHYRSAAITVSSDCSRCAHAHLPLSPTHCTRGIPLTRGGGGGWYLGG